MVSVRQTPDLMNPVIEADGVGYLLALLDQELDDDS
jgi:hypothetical protein